MTSRTLGAPPATDVSPPAEKVTQLDPDKITWADRLDMAEQAGVEILELFDGESTPRKEVALQWMLARKNGSTLTFKEYCAQPIATTDVIGTATEKPAPKARARKRAASA